MLLNEKKVNPLFFFKNDQMLDDYFSSGIDFLNLISCYPHEQ